MAVNGIIGIKLGMTRVFAEDGAAVPCTVLQAGPCVVVQRRSKQTDGYDAVQLGFLEAHDRPFQKGQCRAHAHAARDSSGTIER